MKLLPALVAALILLPSVAQADDAADLKKMQGTWKILKMQRGGMDAPPQFLKGKMVVEKKTFTLVMSANGMERKSPIEVKIDSTKSPSRIDFVNKKGEVSNIGIYKLDGKKLTICFVRKDGERPSKFESKEGSKVMMMVLEKK